MDPYRTPSTPRPRREIPTVSRQRRPYVAPKPPTGFAFWKCCVVALLATGATFGVAVYRETSRSAGVVFSPAPRSSIWIDSNQNALHYRAPSGDDLTVDAYGRITSLSTTPAISTGYLIDTSRSWTTGGAVYMTNGTPTRPVKNLLAPSSR